MKPRTLSRLDMLAAEQERQWLDAIRRASATLKQTEQQRGVLAAYRGRLAASWQDGAVLPAAQARRAAQFITASHGAEAQIDQTAAQAEKQLEASITGLAQIRARRHTLSGMQRKAATQAEREAERRQERDIPFHRPIRP